MSREDNIKKALAKVLKAYDKMNNSIDIEHVQEKVYVNKNLTIKIECERMINGRPYSFEFYAVRGKEEIDCCSLHHPDNVDSEIAYLLNCYV